MLFSARESQHHQGRKKKKQTQQTWRGSVLNARLFCSPLFLLRKKKKRHGIRFDIPVVQCRALSARTWAAGSASFIRLKPAAFSFFSFSPPKDVDHTEAALIRCHSIGREKKMSQVRLRTGIHYACMNSFLLNRHSSLMRTTRLMIETWGAGSAPWTVVPLLRKTQG